MSNALVTLYREMLRIRMIEEAIAAAYSDQEMRCPVHLSIGQEGPAVGVCKALRPEDVVMSGHRCHAHYLAKGGALKPMIAELYGKSTGCTGGKGGSMHLVDVAAGFLAAAPIVASTIPIAVGTAFSAKRRGIDRITTVFFGEGATESGAFHESLNLAVLHKLPIIFVCENNLYSVYSPLTARQPEGRKITDVARSLGVAAGCHEGNDVSACFSAASTAMTHVRGGNGPFFLEFSTYRWREHCGPNFDDDLGYRPADEVNTWQSKCPILQAEELLSASGTDMEPLKSAAQAEFSKEINDAFYFARKSSFPDASEAYRRVLA